MLVLITQSTLVSEDGTLDEEQYEAAVAKAAINASKS